ncbi:hypothetical protein Fleli_1974 [Bernardetia litoralis DSM 6794]|uniref:Uncharacterized protein n=1 Tax=Bernardetia litoralis (strain ATCC 23117 / DSM 6794 / NBRC 15988 / NCIMB 1366 / Fx l1 / Sio-4) TaxID=880071 RepID=I4AK74_BERLS|nr:T9SS type A sorting domain-containing protein [Bernardetia litoralis]AFM04359.1 hypothetical protein Fleli_1974 [Bernardetia litoralis DSM 6794]
MKHLLLLFILLFYSAFALGQDLVTYDFAGENGNQIFTSTSSVATNMTASSFTRGSGVAAAGAGNSISSTGWSTGAINLNDYYSFTVTPDAGYSLDLDNLNFGERRSGSGIRNFEIRTSLDGYSASYFSTTFGDNTSTRHHNFTFTPAFSNITTAITIRIYGYNAESSGGTWRIVNNSTTNNFSLTGTVNSTTPPNIDLTFDDTGDLNIAQGSSSNAIFRTQADVTLASATLNQVTLQTNGTYTSTDITASGFKLWYSDDATFGGDTQISSVSSSTGNGETITFTGLSQSIPIGTGYFFVTADISTSATLNNTVGIANTTTADFTFATPSTKSGTANSGNLHTIIGLNTGIITPTSFCVTPTQNESVTVPFTYSPTGLYTGGFTAQLSDATGDFSLATDIGSIASDNTGSQSISAIIPANTAQGSNYRIRVISSVPSVEGADNGTDITIDLLTVSIAPTATQNISQFQNGTTLTVTESNTISSRKWKYSTVSGSGYTNFLGSSDNETPYFESVGTYYMVVETVFDCGKTVISNEVQINVTTFVGTQLFPGDMAIVGWDGQIGGGDDDFVITNLVELTNGTTFLLVNATYENGKAANTRTNEWASVATVEFVYNNATPLPAGSIISFELPSTANNSAVNIRVNGVSNSDFSVNNITQPYSGISGRVNISTSGADQLFLMQGSFNATSTEFDGYVLFGMTNDSDWIDFSANVYSGRTSRLHPHILCINTTHPTGPSGSYFDYSTASFRTADQRTILGHITNMSNWTNTTSLPSDVHSTTFNVTSATIKSQWIGDQDENWFECQNWSSLYVPNQYTNVEFTNTAVDDSRIDETADFSDEYLDIAKAKNLILGEKTLKIYESRLARLDIYEDFTIQNTGVLDMDNDFGLVEDGTINLSGNWTNTVGTSAFEEGESIIVFQGGNGQTITTAGEESFYDVTLNSGQDLTINNTNTQTIIKGELIFQSGNIRSTTANPLTFDVDAFHTGANVNRHIKGASRRLSNKVEDFEFPIGKSGIYRPIIIHTQSGGTSTQFFAEYFFTPYTNVQPVLTPLDHVSHIEHWILNREYGSADTRLTLSWGAESIVGSLASLVVAHWTSSNQWESEGNSFTTGDITAGTVKSSDIITQFSPFTLGTIDNLNLLPVTWVSFDAKYNQEQENVLLEWNTLAEHQNQSFVIERSEDGIDFQEIGFKKGEINTHSIKNYQFWDFEILHTKTYYRIKQIDTNGDFSYSNIKMIETKSDRKIGITNFENKTILYSNLKKATKAKVQVYDMNGNTVGFFEVFLKYGQNELILPLANISKAIYVYKIELENQSEFVTGKFLIK